MADLIGTMGVVGFWASPIKYEMYDPRTNNHSYVIIPGADDPTIVEPAERDDIVEEYKERFAEDLRDKPTHLSMDKGTQHGLGKQLIEIKESKRRHAEVGHGRYW